MNVAESKETFTVTYDKTQTTPSRLIHGFADCHGVLNVKAESEANGKERRVLKLMVAEGIILFVYFMALGWIANTLFHAICESLL